MAFGALLDLIGRLVQTRLHQRMIEGAVLFATGHKREPGQIGKHGSGPILAVESEQGVFLEKLVCGEIPADDSEALSEFRAVPPIASVSKGAEPLETVSLADNRARPHDLSSHAPSVARSTDLIQPAKRRGEFFRLG